MLETTLAIPSGSLQSPVHEELRLSMDGSDPTGPPGETKDSSLRDRLPGAI